MSQDKTPPAKDAGAEYAEIWGEAIHSNRHLRTITVGLGLAVIFVIMHLTNYGEKHHNI